MSKFKVGDFIRIRGGRNIVQVDEVTDCRYAVHGKQEFYTIYSDRDNYDIEHLSPKSAFLAELKELLAKYDAEILAAKYQKDANTIKPYIQIDLNGHKDKPITYENTLHDDFTYINANNVMNYDKEGV